MNAKEIITDSDYWTILRVELSENRKDVTITAKGKYVKVNVPRVCEITVTKRHAERLNRQKHGIPFFYLKDNVTKIKHASDGKDKKR